jgi:hypothetical protein
MWVRFPLTRIKHCNYTLINKPAAPANLIFNFTFASLFSPVLLNTTHFMFDNFAKLNRRISLKQSYVILSWFYYINTLKFKQDDKKKIFRFFVIPVKKQILTVTKAPLAHKKWSREQYKFQFYNIRISFKSIFFDEPLDGSFTQTLLFFLTMRKLLPAYETNLFVIKNFRLLLNICEPEFFNFYLY